MAKLEELGYVPSTDAASAEAEESYSDEEKEMVEDRLRALGYM